MTRNIVYLVRAIASYLAVVVVKWSTGSAHVREALSLIPAPSGLFKSACCAKISSVSAHSEKEGKS